MATIPFHKCYRVGELSEFEGLTAIGIVSGPRRAHVNPGTSLGCSRELSVSYE